jgi:hypothetical protein
MFNGGCAKCGAVEKILMIALDVAHRPIPITSMLFHSVSQLLDSDSGPDHLLLEPQQSHLLI